MKFLNDMKTSMSGETMKNVMHHRNIKLVATNSKISSLKTKQNYHRMKWFLKNLLAIKMNKAKVKMSKLNFLGLSVLDSNKATYDYCYGYVKPKYGDKPKQCYIDTDSLIVYVKLEEEVLVDNVEIIFDTSKYEFNRSLPIKRNRKVIGLMKDRLGGRCIAISQMMNMLTRKQRTQKVRDQTRSKIQDYKECLKNNKIILRSEQRFRSNAYNVFTEHINKIALSANDDRKIKTPDGLTTCPYSYGSRIIGVESLSM